MANLKEKILQALKNSSKLELTLDDVSKSKENLLKNHSNPVFNQKDKNKILKKFTDLQEVEKSLQRYNKLNENDYLEDAREEKENVETVLLKGGISYNRYVWHSENSENTCDVCKSLDGKEFDFYDEVPERPHPNCKCTVEIIEDTDSNSSTETTEEENTNTIKIPPENPNPKSSPKPPQPNPASKNPSPPQPQRWILPVSKGHKITSNYGYRMHPVYHTMKLHDGIDINALANTPVYAVADGKVSVSGWISGYGNYIQIEHANGLSSFYAHLNMINVKRGNIVTQGQSIGKSGNTGIGTGPHLHFGAKKNGVSVDPTIYLPGF